VCSDLMSFSFFTARHIFKFYCSINGKAVVNYFYRANPKYYYIKPNNILNGSAKLSLFSKNQALITQFSYSIKSLPVLIQKNYELSDF